MILKRLLSLTGLAIFTSSLSAQADTSIVFNEIMYHPATNEPAMEWVELYNQMAVDVEMTGWSLDGDIHYSFPSNTIVHGGAYLVVAISPTNLAAATGLNVTNILGPFAGTNRLSNSGGKLLLRNNNGRKVNEVEYDTSGDWSVAPDGSGVSLAKIDPTTGSAAAANWTMSAQMGGTPARANFTNYVGQRLSFNEVSASTNATFWLELMNYGTNSMGVGGYVIVRDGATNGEYVLSPGTTISAGGFLTLSNTTLGFKPVADDKLYLLPAGRSNVIDAVLLKNGPRARSPDGTGAWLKPAVGTPGSSNSFLFHREIVINEIMYHHIPYPAPATNLAPIANDEAWLELYNKSTNIVNLTGWSLSGGISYSFPSGKTIAPGAYLVVAKNSATLKLSYPALDIIGDFSGKLSHNGDSIVLEDANENPVSSVRYYTAGRWPEAADAGGCSLELRDPNADTTRPEAWAASDESGKTSWQTFTYQGVATNHNGIWPTVWDDFLLGLLNGGECLVDDVSVIESPSGTAVQFIANGNFESGATGWRFLGTHSQSRVEPEPGNPSNHVLHIIASGPQEDLHNHIETTYTGGKSVTDGRTYQISYRARWLKGNNLLNTRLYYNRLPRTMVLPTPVLNGTPGAQNSLYATNIGPTFSQFRHTPVIPVATQSVTVSVVASDPQSVSNCEVWWSANGGAFGHAAMNSQGNGLYAGTIPGFAASSIVQFYVQATDGLGAVSTWPARGSNAGALYMVNDSQANLARGHNFRVILSPANWALLRAQTNLMSNEYLPCTMIYDEQRPYYDLGVRLKGSESGRVVDPDPSFHMEFQPDDLFRGVHPTLIMDTSGRPGFANPQLEIIAHHMANHAGGIPDIQMDLCYVIPPYLTNTSSAVLEPQFEDEFIATAFPNGDNGAQFLMELTYYPTTDNAAGYKLPSPQSLVGVDMAYINEDKETYRYNFILKNHRSDDDYGRFLAFIKMMSMPNTALLDQQSQEIMDVNEWLRVYALVSLLGESDWYTFGQPHNIIIYNRPEDNKMLVFPWDTEQLFLRSGGASASLIGNASYWTDLESLFPANKRRLYAHAQDIIATTFNTAYMTYWVNHYTNFLPGQSFSELLTWIPQRVSAINSQINTLGGNTAFAISGTNFIVASTNLITISGTAPVQIQSLLVNGIAYDVNWTSFSAWNIKIPVNMPTNVLNITAFDVNGKPLTNFSGTVTVKYTGTPPNPIGSVGFNEIMYNPVLPAATYVELYNNSTNSFDLSNWRLNGTSYTFPAGSVITNRQFLLLVKDASAMINVYGSNLPPYGEFTGELQTNGETLTLFMPAATTNLPDVIVDRVKYSNTLPWPSNAPGVSLQIKSPSQDHFRAGNWAAAAGTPRATNTSVNAAITPFPTLWLNEVQADNLTGITNSAGQRTAWLEIYNPGSNTVFLTNLYLTKAYTNLTAWQLPTNGVINPGQFKILFADGLTNLSTANEPHANFVLPAGAGSLALSRIANSQTQVLDYVDYTNLAPNRSYGSFPDGQSFDRMEFFYVTPGGTNNSASAPITVVINEWMAGNTHTLTNPTSGKFSDWFELYNYGTNPASLNGFYLTDSLTNKFQFAIPPGYTIPPQGFLLVWADGKDTNGTPDLHTTFKMDKDGESLGLYGADGVPVDFVNYGPQASDISEGRFPDAAAGRFFMPTPTPRTNNVIPNSAPSVTPVANIFVHVGQTAHFTATATDAQSAFQTLAFSLDSAPGGATIGPLTGSFSWLATNTPPSTNAVTVRVTDDGTPQLSGTASFSIIVLPLPQFGTAAPIGGLLPLIFSTLPGQNYQIQYKDDLSDPDWLPLTSLVPGTGGILEVDDNATGQDQRFYRLVVGP